MEIGRKKVLILPLEGVLTKGGDITDFSVSREILDRIRHSNITMVCIIRGESEDADYDAKVRTIEYFVFSYCKIAVRSYHRENVYEDIMNTVQHSMRDRKHFLSVGCKIENIDNISLEDFLCTK